MTMKMIVVTGMPGAGKEEFLSAGMASGIPFIRMGDVVRECYKASGSESRGITVGQFAGNERNEHGTDIWARRVMEKMQGNKICIVDGCRSMDEITTFKKLGGDIVIVGIHASPSVRYDRIVKRKRDDAPADIDEFNDRDNRELSWGVGTVLALADFIVDNMCGLDEFHRRSAELMRSLQ